MLLWNSRKPTPFLFSLHFPGDRPVTSLALALTFWVCCKLSPWALPPRRRHRTTLELPAFRGEALPGCSGRGRRGKQPSEISKDRGGRGRPLGLADCKTGRAGWRAGCASRPHGAAPGRAQLLFCFHFSQVPFAWSVPVVCVCVCVGLSLPFSLALKFSYFLNPCHK